MNLKLPDSTAWHFDFVLLFPSTRQLCLQKLQNIVQNVPSWHRYQLTDLLKLFIPQNTCWWWKCGKNSKYKAVTLVFKNFSDPSCLTLTCNTCLLCICSFVFLCWICQLYLCQRWLSLSVCMARLIKFFNNKRKAIVVLLWFLHNVCVRFTDSFKTARSVTATSEWGNVCFLWFGWTFELLSLSLCPLGIHKTCLDVGHHLYPHHKLQFSYQKKVKSELWITNTINNTRIKKDKVE